MGHLQFHLDAAASTKDFEHYWEKCVGSCHGYTALREDYRNQLKKVKEDVGFQYVRFHGILNDDMSVVFEKEHGGLEYNFVNIDNIIDFLLSIDMRPFIEISFMPSPFASGEQTCFHYKGNVTMPKDFQLWDSFIVTFIQHLVERYGVEEVQKWYFEVWNEPNLKFFFAGNQEDYFTLYEHTVRAIKSVDAGLRTGGPSTANNAWILDIIEYCKKNHVPIDFISTHHYPTDDPNWNGDMNLDDFIQKEKRDTGGEVDRRGILTRMAKKAKAEAGELPLYYTEWNTSANEGDAVHDTSYSSALMVKTLLDNYGYADIYSFWTFSDIFEEHGQAPGEFRGGFGLQTIHGIPKPAYRALELMHQLGSRQYQKEAEQGTAGVFAASGRDEKMCIIAYNHEMPGKPIKAENIKIDIKNISVVSASIQRIDDAHANARSEWEKMGSPVYPDTEQIKSLKRASFVQEETLCVTKTENGISLEFCLPEHGVALIKLK
ncbi:MAG: beta-xylosidase [Lachnospiraceae bacterium]|nr:beta-xylosidase [Lachnospiraceae bacterium]